MHAVIESHRLSSKQQGHLTFILRKATEPVKTSTVSKRHSSLRIRTGNSGTLDGSMLLSPGLERQRRPSILDMLMDSPKEAHTSTHDVLHESPKSLPKSSPKSAEMPPLPDAQRTPVDRKFSNSSHLLSDMSESRKSSLASLLSGDPYKSVRTASTAPTSPMDFTTDRSRQMSLASLASSSSIMSEDAQKSASAQQALRGSEHVTPERRDKTFTLSFRKIVPWSAKSKRHDMALSNITGQLQDSEDSRINLTGSRARQFRSTQMADGSSDRVFSQSTSYHDISPTVEKPVNAPKLSTASSATAKLCESATTSDDIPKMMDVKVAKANQSSDDDSNNYATYAQWLRNLPATETMNTSIEVVTMKSSASDSIYPDRYNSAAAPKKKEFNSTHITPVSNKPSPSSSTPPLSAPSELSTNNKTNVVKLKAESVHTPELGELSYLITNGIGFLENKESSKWDDDGGYEFHPWNRPKSKCLPSGESTPTVEDVENLSIGEASINLDNCNVTHEHTSSCLASAYAKNGPVVEAKDMEQV
ncbi:hypothetical protein BGW37DRAFT_186668 [Umbelopsis sp. PMI_123]|nr:hypothetical protein BGW37DRAFT_186668 [Umbelopsis sp. PMI_123]